MATLTSALSITGTINGRTIGFTNTYTLAGVLDGAHRNGQVPANGQTTMMKGTGGSGTGPAPPVNYAYPAFVCAINKSTGVDLQFSMSEETSGTMIGVLLRPKEFFLMHSNATNGCWVVTATATTITLIDNDKFTIGPADEATVSFDVMGAYKA